MKSKENGNGDDYGIKMSEENGRFYLIFDEGGFVQRFRTIEITEDEAKKARSSQKDAYEVILSFQKKEHRKE